MRLAIYEPRPTIPTRRRTLVSADTRTRVSAALRVLNIVARWANPFGRIPLALFHSITFGAVDGAATLPCIRLLNRRCMPLKFSVASPSLTPNLSRVSLRVNNAEHPHPPISPSFTPKTLYCGRRATSRRAARVESRKGDEHATPVGGRGPR